MSPTIREVAREAGVSIATVSHALSGKRPVSERTRQRIARAVERLGYRPNAIAAAMTTGRTQTLGIVVPDIANPFFGELVGAVERAAAARGYSVIASSSELDATLEVRAVRTLRDRRVDALIHLAGTDVPNPAFDELSAADVPTVWLDEELPHLSPASNVVTVDNEDGGALAAQHLVALGHRELGVVSGPQALPTARARLGGFLRAATAAGVAPPARRVRHAPAYTVEAGRAAGAELLAAEPATTAVFCANDLIALGVCQAARDAGLRVPDTLSVVGFDDSFVAALVTPPLTTISQPVARLGKEAAEIAIDLVEGHRAEPVRLTLSVDLVVRGSTSQRQPSLARRSA